MDWFAGHSLPNGLSMRGRSVARDRYGSKTAVGLGASFRMEDGRLPARQPAKTFVQRYQEHPRAEVLQPPLSDRRLRTRHHSWPGNTNPALTKIAQPQIHHGRHQRIVEGVVLIQHRQIQIAQDSGE
jgi:hypothetical protein